MTDTNVKHTALPWPAPEYDNDTGPNDESFWEFWRIEGVADFDNKEDAEFAHRACNSHYELLEALKQVLAHTERLNNVIAGQNIEFHTSGPWHAAIAKAGAKP